jgi:hypothetical protein
MLTTQRYAQLKSRVLAILYQEGLQSFARGRSFSSSMFRYLFVDHAVPAQKKTDEDKKPLGQ